MKSSFGSLKDAVESLLRHGVQPLCALDVSSDELLNELLPLIDALPQVLWLMVLELSAKSAQRVAFCSAFLKVQSALEARGEPLGAILVMDWLEGNELLERLAAQRLMRRQLESLGSLPETVLVLPRRAGHIEIHGKEVKISRLSVTLEKHWKLLSWFKKEKGLCVEVIASNELLEHEVLRAVESALWINEQILSSLGQKLELNVGGLSQMDAWSFLVTLCAMESWPEGLSVASSSFRSAREAILKAKARHEAQGTAFRLVGRRWEQTLMARQKSSLKSPLSSSLSSLSALSTAEVAAELFLRWRRKLRATDRSLFFSEAQRLHVATAEQCLGAVLLLPQQPDADERRVSEAVKAVKAAKEASARSLPPLLLRKSEASCDVTREVEAAAVAALIYVQGFKRSLPRRVRAGSSLRSLKQSFSFCSAR